MRARPVVVLGFGVAAANAIVALRGSGYEGPVTVINDAGPDPYSPVLSSYYVGGRVGRESCFAWSHLDWNALVSDIRAGVRVAALDVADRVVSLSDGAHVAFSKLLIATGARPVSPNFESCEELSPHVLRTIVDADRLRAALMSPNCKRVLVSGTSMVGLKAVEACLDRGIDVTMVGRSSQILRGSAHPLVAHRFEKLLEQRGVTMRLSCTIERIGPQRTGRGYTVRFDDGTAGDFEEVIVAHGVKPNADFVPEGSLAMDRGILVDQFMRTSAPDVFAAGDVAQALDLMSGERRVRGIWRNAVQQGRAAGRAIAAELAGRTPSIPYRGSISENVIHVDGILFASAGTLAEADGRRFEVRESAGAFTVLAYDTAGFEERLVGFNVLASGGAESLCDSAADSIGVFRSEVMRSYV